MSKKSGFIGASLFFISLAVGFSVYLTHLYYSLHYGFSSSNSLCAISQFFNCSSTSLSTFSSLFGVPTALWGLLAYLFYGFLLGKFLFISRFNPDSSLKSSAAPSLWHWLQG